MPNEKQHVVETATVSATPAPDAQTPAPDAQATTPPAQHPVPILANPFAAAENAVKQAVDDKEKA